MTTSTGDTSPAPLPVPAPNKGFPFSGSYGPNGATPNPAPNPAPIAGATGATGSTH
jgi:hypothetical protein